MRLAYLIVVEKCSWTTQKDHHWNLASAQDLGVANKLVLFFKMTLIILYWFELKFAHTPASWLGWIFSSLMNPGMTLQKFFFLWKSEMQNLNFIQPEVILWSTETSHVHSVDSHNVCRWLLSKGQDSEAHRILALLAHPVDQKEEYRIQAENEQGQRKKSFLELLSSKSLQKELNLGQIITTHLYDAYDFKNFFFVGIQLHDSRVQKSVANTRISSISC